MLNFCIQVLINVKTFADFGNCHLLCTIGKKELVSQLSIKTTHNYL